MALPTSGPISLGDVNEELGKSSTATISLNDSDVRGLAEIPSGEISLGDLRGCSSTPSVFCTASFGDTICGGIYMGQICAAGQCYALIVAPNATGCARCQWKTTRTATAGTASLVDGFANTYGPLDNADHPAGNFCATRTINGFSDWYLPAIAELEVFYNNGATGNNESVIGAGEAFASTGYWSSTEYTATYACYLTFVYGYRFINMKTNSDSSVRAVRREPI